MLPLSLFGNPTLSAGTLAGASSFVEGFHLAGYVVAAAFLVAAALSFVWSGSTSQASAGRAEEARDDAEKTPTG